MRSRRGLFVIVVAAVMVGPLAPAHGEDVEQATRVTDPDLLRSLGFPPEARNVHAFMGRLNQRAGVADAPSEYFGSLAGYSTYTGKDFTTTRATPNWDWGGCSTIEDLSPFGNGPRDYRVRLEIPEGARFRAVRWWAGDTTPTSDLTFQVHEICHPRHAAGPPVLTLLGSGSTAGSAGAQSAEILMPSNLTVRTKECTYSVFASFGAINCNQALDKVRAEWARQVSPAPATARFLDVPPTHPFFRFVEALAASGITSGCTGNQYCPDSAITRGQMAVFLATALGLSWGGQ